MNPKYIRLLLILAMVGLSVFLALGNPIFKESLLYVLGWMTFLWLVSLALKDSSIIDIFWGFSFVLMSVYYFRESGNYESFDYIFLFMCILWGSRLTFYLGIRNMGKPEDFRYQQFRKEGGINYWWISFFRVFLLQGILVWILSSIFFVAYESAVESLKWIHILGIVVWIIGIFFETAGDAQLKKFKSNPENKGKVLNTGLWALTRHPNYFGDAMVWWGFYLFGFAISHSIVFIAMPMLMTFLLRRVSGVAMLENTLKKTKPGFEEYCKKTPAFYPFIGKK
ncbi:MAG: steroid 5-alpha reductase family enzyme [Arcticibacterium sp.]|jgi:steroid 5-alpha reductase family enzyme